MIKIQVDEAYAFDMLSILEVKYEKKSTQQNLDNLHELSQSIENQVGAGKFFDILNSDEYESLYHTNVVLFDLIDDIKRGEDISAKEVDDLNYLRWEYKNGIQKKFFGKETGEVKIGYGE
jgi:hypothetical protein